MPNASFCNPGALPAFKLTNPVMRFGVMYWLL
jgi:hypothetical protein